MESAWERKAFREGHFHASRQPGVALGGPGVEGNDQLLLPVLGDKEVARVSMNAFPGKGQRGAALDQTNRPIAQGHNADVFGGDGLDEFGAAFVLPVTGQRRATSYRSVQVWGFDDGGP